MASSVEQTIDAVWRMESPRLIAGLTRLVRDVGLAEELAQEALVFALEQWKVQGIPDNPGAWLMAAAKHRAVDQFRRRELLEQKHEQMGQWQVLEQSLSSPDWDEALDNHFGDDLLRLLFIACHPVLSTEARVALTLRLLGGLTTTEIARAFLVSEATMAQRIVRAKRTLADRQVPFDMPRGEALTARLSSVLEVLYLIFNEGYSATTGDDWLRPELCADALRLGRVLAQLAPQEPEVHGLIALMELQASRAAARTSLTGEPVLLLDQNRGRWDFVLITRGLKALDLAKRLTNTPGPYQLQAEIAGCHARARHAADTDWRHIAELYDALLRLVPSPVVALNRAVAVGMAQGPEQGLQLVDELAQTGELDQYHLLPSVRGDFLFKLGRFEEARKAFLKAAALTQNVREKTLLQHRAGICERAASSPP